MNYKPTWYFQIQKPFGTWRFYLGRIARTDNLKDKKHWCLNIGLYFIDFGKGY